MLTIRSIILAAVSTAALLTTSACAPTAEPTASPTATNTTTATSAPTTAPTVFTMPTDCEQILPAARLEAFADADLVLLGGPGGKFPNYLIEATPEESAGGITCIWGDESTRLSSFTVSVAPLTAANRSTVVDGLVAQGLNEGTAGNASTFSKQGDETEEPAILNVLLAESWISVICTKGGFEAAEQAQLIADDVVSAVYREL